MCQVDTGTLDIFFKKFYSLVFMFRLIIVFKLIFVASEIGIKVHFFLCEYPVVLLLFFTEDID